MSGTVETVLLGVAAEVELQGARDPQFVAVGIDVPAGAVDVWRTGDPSDGPGVSYRAEVPAEVELRVHRAVLSQQQKLALDALVESNVVELQTRGFDVVQWGMLDGWGRPYVIGYDGPPTPPDDLVEAFAIFGAGTAVLRRETAPDGGVGIATFEHRQHRRRRGTDTPSHGC